MQAIEPGPFPILAQRLPGGLRRGQAALSHQPLHPLFHAAVDKNPVQPRLAGQNMVGAQAHHHAGAASRQ